MAGEKEIRSKIASVKNMQKITSAMEKVAASKIRKAQKQMELMGKMMGAMAELDVKFTITVPGPETDALGEAGALARAEVDGVAEHRAGAEQSHDTGVAVPVENLEILLDDKLVALSNEYGVADLSIEPGIHYLEIRLQDSVVLDQQILFYRQRRP